METRYAFQCYIIVPAPNQAAANAKLKAYGMGPDTFSIGLSTTGNAPAQAYHAAMCLQLKDLPGLKWFADNAPRAWVWVRVRTDVLTHSQSVRLQQLRERFDLEPYQSVDWQTRTKAYVRVVTQELRPQAAFNWLAANANPAVSLKLIT